ncbi:NAD(P)-dependent alcohol dehydrogenase [Amycolatopsis vancoresmycina]|uniref:alcohol dehydrogenase n=1 Tax=Amycolatopsis vancoresmycina DSM 44592 TaxID=1292037 RepID=R1FZ25_9PSEU|nr:NAD(P)-dependent alcohol dehydrogenase [Amycolatopsis vancoresmycina]EOD64547.1 molecular chaperone GroES [Amycolatopsis vancoresmycina DSM 44592]
MVGGVSAPRKSPALRLTAWGRPPSLADVDVPDPGGTEVLVRVEAAGICHSDLHVLDAAPGALPYRLPFTLGHEIAGQVVAAGSAATGVADGDRVAVHGPWGCGECRRCAAGEDNYCHRRAELAFSGAGLGRDGGMAGHVLVPHPRHLVPIGDLAASQAAPLTDAGLTPYHAVAGLTLAEGAAAVVIGAGGLGHVAIQLLRALTPARVFAVDVREEALELAARSGAHRTLRPGPDTAAVLRRETGGGAEAVLDFVGSDPTLSLGAGVLRPAGSLVIVGSGGGKLTIAKPGVLPPGVSVSLPFWGSARELREVIALARAGRLRVETEPFPLTAAADAFQRLREGRIRGRAVLLPGS